MAPKIQTNFRIRHSFGKIERILEVPNLIDIQMRSYDKFLQSNIPRRERRDVGLQGVFKSVYPIRDFNGTSELTFEGYTLERPKYDVEECRQRGMTYAAPIKVTIQLIIYDNADGGERAVRDIKEQEVYFGEIPLMTENGTFIINGTERVVVSQLHRSPGVFFDHDKGKTHSSGKYLYQARIIPYRGSWLDFEFDPKDLLYVRIDRRRKMHATVLLKALGYNTHELLDFYYDTETLFFEPRGKYAKSIEYELLPGQRATRDIKVGNDTLVKKNRKFTRAAIRKLQAAKLDKLPIDETEVIGKVSAEDVIDEETGEILLGVNEEITEEKLEAIREAKIPQVKVLFIDGLNVGSYLRDTLLADKVTTRDEAILEIYRRLRPGDPPTLDTARTLFNNLFFNPERYDLSKVGRLKLNYKFHRNEDGEKPELDKTVLTERDILETVRHLIELKNGRGSIDDIDHLGNRRVRAVGELMENQYRIGLVRMERAIKERMSMSQEIETLMPHDLINAKPVSAVVKEYFGSSQLSQFMDQTNPLSEVTHKRRLSALGPGGLTRERAGFEVRDVHTTHYGRICPIETPEGPNIGLIASLSTFARVNEYGFVETPYRKVVDGKVKDDDLRWYSALEEEGHHIAQANADIDKKTKKLNGTLISARFNGDFVMVPPDQVELMDVSPNQLVSVAASLIPFLEHDDANRALMGSNMQRQAVPCLRSYAPIAGTGIEGRVAGDSGVCIVAKRDGTVESVDATRIVVKAEGEAGAFPDIYRLNKFQRSNQSTAYNQTPIIRPGDKVKAGDVMADGPSCDHGELALGQNCVVAFMPWGGYNFEDSILISERIVKDDVYTSVHIEEFECVARDTKLGKEEITRDIPNVGEEALKDLDESGIVRIGAEVKSGDILVGKITPKGETQLSPEEKLLRAIFGEKAGDVRDTSLRVPPGVSGIVIDARVFARKGADKDERAKQIEDAERAKLEKDMADEIKIIKESAYAKVRKMLSVAPRPRSWWTTRARSCWPRAPRSTPRRSTRSSASTGDTSRSTRTRRRSTRFWRQLDEQCSDGGRGSLPGEDRQAGQGRRAPAGRDQDGEGLPRHQAQAAGRRQDGRSARKQGCRQSHPSGGGSSLPSGRNAGRHRAQPARCSEPHERRTDPRDPLRVGRTSARSPALRRCDGRRSRPQGDSHQAQEDLQEGRGSRAGRRARRQGHHRFVKTLKNGLHLATPVFDGATEEEIHDLLERPLAFRPTVRPCSSTAAPARRSTRTSPSASCTCSSCTTWWTTRSTRAASGPTRWSLSSRSAERRSSVDSVSARWRSGRWRPTARRTRCRSS